MKRIGLITSGGDAPGMNAAIRAVTRSAISHEAKVIGFYFGYCGILAEEHINLRSNTVGGIISHGGTILRTARCKEFYKKPGRKKVVDILKQHEIDSLVVIGGDGSLSGAQKLYQEFDFPVIGIPASIDNDIYGSDFSIGFDTAINTALSAIDKVRDTAYSHDRVFVIEVMGRENGFIALNCGLAAGAEGVIIPEYKYDLDRIAVSLIKMRERGKISSIIIVAEGAGKAHDISEKLEKKNRVLISTYGPRSYAKRRKPYRIR